MRCRDTRFARPANGGCNRRAVSDPGGVVGAVLLLWDYTMSGIVVLDRTLELTLALRITSAG
jgi:hypothetical protein